MELEKTDKITFNQYVFISRHSKRVNSTLK
jgi:hypothetical protein